MWMVETWIDAHDSLPCNSRKNYWLAVCGGLTQKVAEERVKTRTGAPWRMMPHDQNRLDEDAVERELRVCQGMLFRSETKPPTTHLGQKVDRHA